MLNLFQHPLVSDPETSLSHGDLRDDRNGAFRNSNKLGNTQLSKFGLIRLIFVSLHIFNILDKMFVWQGKRYCCGKMRYRVFM